MGILTRFSVLACCLCLAANPAVSQRQARPPRQAPVDLATTPASLTPGLLPVRSCESLTSVSLPNTTIVSAVPDAGDGRTPPSCRITATVTHPPAGDSVKIWVGLPSENWNGRFRGAGGGGFSGGNERGILRPLSLGFATAATDTGHEGNSAEFALGADGRPEWMLIRDNAYLGIHEMTVVAKALTAEYYGTPARYSYFADCSTGGRQGLMEAQRYPADYDGILAGAPAINWPKLHVAQMWGQLVMLEADHFVPACKFEAARAASVKACDGIDGVEDDLVQDPLRCKYDPAELVGASTADCGAITQADADIIRMIWEGPRRKDGSFLWYGLARGADFRGLNATTDGAGAPFRTMMRWYQYFLTQDPDWDWTTLTHESFEHFWDQSNEQFGGVIGSDNPDLSAFHERGGKAIVWHGWSDQLIYAQGTIDYYERVRHEMGEQTSDFIRLFMAPGVAHCRGGSGPQPDEHFGALMDWVEAGHAPDSIRSVRRNDAGEVIRTRPLCPYPLVPKYKGSGSTDDASNFQCSFGF